MSQPETSIEAKELKTDESKQRDYGWEIKVGDRFGRLLVLERSPIKTSTHISWVCLCDCGNTATCPSSSLRSGATSSCGCFQKEKHLKRVTKHGNRQLNGTSKEYMAWINMKTRCYNSNDKLYHRYGGRGISVCDDWLHDFDCFLRDMGESPSIKHSVERTNNNEGYNKDNCVWATKWYQSRNVSTNRWLESGGKKMVITDWARELGISPTQIRYHLRKNKTMDEIVKYFQSSLYVKKKKS